MIDAKPVRHPGGEYVQNQFMRGLEHLFRKNDHVLVVNNDCELRPDTYRHLLADGGEFVTAVGTRDPEKIKPPYVVPDSALKRNHPDFGAYLIRRSVWEKVGPFDEKFLIGYGEDCCMHLRMHRAGIAAYALELPYLHYGAQTLKNAEPEEQQLIQKQADRNREYFREKYGFSLGSPEYYREFNGEAPVEETEPKEVAPI